MGNIAVLIPQAFRVRRELVYVQWPAWVFQAVDAQGPSFSHVHLQGPSLVLPCVPQDSPHLWSNCLWPDQEASQGQYPPRSWRQDANRWEQRIFHGSAVNEELTLFGASISLSSSSPSLGFPSLVIFTLECLPGLQEPSIGKRKTIKKKRERERGGFCFFNVVLASLHSWL